MERKITVGNLELDADAMSATVSGGEVSLTTREFNIMYKLLSYPKKTFSRAQLMDEFWGVDSDTGLRAVAQICITASLHPEKGYRQRGLEAEDPLPGKDQEKEWYQEGRYDIMKKL